MTPVFVDFEFNSYIYAANMPLFNLLLYLNLLFILLKKLVILATK